MRTEDAKLPWRAEANRFRHTQKSTYLVYWFDCRSDSRKFAAVKVSKKTVDQSHYYFFIFVTEIVLNRPSFSKLEHLNVARSYIMKSLFIVAAIAGYSVVLLAPNIAKACSNEQISGVEYIDPSRNIYRCTGDLSSIFCSQQGGGLFFSFKKDENSNQYIADNRQSAGNIEAGWVYTLPIDTGECVFLEGRRAYYEPDGEISQSRRFTLGRPVAIGSAKPLDLDSVARKRKIDNCVRTGMRDLSLAVRIGPEDDFNRKIYDERRRALRTECAKRIE